MPGGLDFARWGRLCQGCGLCQGVGKQRLVYKQIFFWKIARIFDMIGVEIQDVQELKPKPETSEQDLYVGRG